MKKSVVYIAVLALIGFSVSSCKKGEYVPNSEALSRLQVKGESLFWGRIFKINGTPYQNSAGSFLFPFPADSVATVRIEETDGTLVAEQTLKVIPGLNSITAYYIDPLDLTKIALGENGPLDNVAAETNALKFKVINLNTKLSPDGEPFHLVLQQFKDEYDAEYRSVYFERKDTLFNVIAQQPEAFFSYPLQTAFPDIYPDGVTFRAQVLKADKRPLIIGGLEVYVFISNAKEDFSGSAKVFVSYILEQDFMDYDQLDYTTPMKAASAMTFISK